MWIALNATILIAPCRIRNSYIWKSVAPDFVDEDEINITKIEDSFGEMSSEVFRSGTVVKVGRSIGRYGPCPFKQMNNVISIMIEIEKRFNYSKMPYITGIKLLLEDT